MMKTKNNCHCQCHDDLILVLDSKQTAFTSVGIIGIGLFLFIGGYLIGKKNAFDAFAKDMSDQSFADKLHHSMTMLYGTEQKRDDAENESPELIQEPIELTEQKLEMPQQEEPHENYYAQLDRFSTRSAAQHLVDRLQKRGIATTLVKRTGNTRLKDGKKQTTAWYVVTTPVLPSRSQAEALVSSIKITENLKKVTYLKK